MLIATRNLPFNFVHAQGSGAFVSSRFGLPSYLCNVSWRRKIDVMCEPQKSMRLFFSLANGSAHSKSPTYGRPRSRTIGLVVVSLFPELVLVLLVSTGGVGLMC